MSSLLSSSMSVSTKNSYIIELFQWIEKNQEYEKKDDCVMVLDTVSGDFSVKSSSNEEKLCYISANTNTDNIVIFSRQINYNFFDYEMRFQGNKFGIRFDKSSASSQKNFLTQFNNIKSKTNFIEKYPSGNIKIEGSKTNNGYQGICIEYYDNPNSQIKYIGEFEDGKYDGAGDFYSLDGNIQLIVKNICSNVPNGSAKLIVGNSVNRMIDMKLFRHLDSTDINYTEKIYSLIEPKFKEYLNLMNFEKLTINDKLIFLYNEVQSMKNNSGNNTTNNKEKPKSFFNLF
jgi:hypothetical protein